MTTQTKPIIASVVRIIDEYTLLIDAGFKKGVSTGMKFVVYTEGENIEGLNGEALGNIEYPKAEVEVTHVQENLSIAKSSEMVSVYNPAQQIAEALESFSYSERKQLPVDDDSIQKLTPVDMKVKVGDKVRQISKLKT